MEVPLSVESKEENGKEFLSLWADGKNIVIPAPVKPYFYALEKLNIAANVMKVEAIRISDFKKVTFYKYEFETRNDLTKARDKIRNERGRGITFEDNIPFTLRTRIEVPDIYTKYPHKNQLKFNFFDIEQYCPSNKLFPTYDDRIISIAFAGYQEKIRAIYLKKDNLQDRKLLEMYKDNYPFPDIEVLYNKRYDLPMLFERYKQNGLDINWFSKNLSKPYVGGKDGAHIEGTLVYDVYDSAKIDQSLTGNVPDKGLKSVSDYQGFKSTAMVIPGNQISNYIGTKELVEYNKEDVARLQYLFDIYFPGIEYTASDLKIPLNIALGLNTTDLGIIVLGDLYKEHGIICDGDNYTRFPEIFQRKKGPDDSNYQGALVFIKRKGLFKPIKKADYSSMYPTIMSEFNFSPDTCKLLRYDKYQKNGFRVEETADTFTYHIPDNQLRKTVVIQTLKRKGFMSIAIKRFLDEREPDKKKWKETGERKYKSRSDNSKVKANGAIYGNMGNPHHPFGFAPAAVGTTGIGRECAELLINVLEKLYPSCVVEVDTDGVYFTAENVNKERIIFYFNKALKEKFKKNLDLTIDIDDYDCGYFHKAKNYILKKENNIILHGAAMKASSKDDLSKNLIMQLARAKLEEKSTETIVRKFKNGLLDFPLSDFAMQVTMGKHLHEYKSTTCISVQMAAKANQHFGIKPKIGISYHYVKCKYGYELFQLAKKGDIDIKYYKDKIDKIVKMLESEYNLSKPLKSYLNGEGREWNEDYEVYEQSKLKKQNVRLPKLKDFVKR